MAASKVEGQKKRSRKKNKLSPVGASPGTLVADPGARQSVLTLTAISPDRQVTLPEASIDLVREYCSEWPLLWLDCAGLADIRLIAEIGELFGLHPLALEDTVNTGQRPKVDFFDDHTFVVASMIDDAATNRYEQISIFFGERFVVTFQEREGDPFDPVRKRIESSKSRRLRTRPADYLAYALLDAVVDSYFPVMEDVAEKIDAFEDEMLNAFDKKQASRLHLMRRNIIVVKRVLGPMRDAVATLVRADAQFIHPETKIYLNDTLDHTTRLLDMVEMYRDVLTGMIDMHLSLSQAKTAEVINLLTLVSTIFIPLTFLVGVWGMNFDPDSSPWNMPELRAYFGYPLALFFMLIVAVFLVLYFRWKKWL
jgi:magnesium transporter